MLTRPVTLSSACATLALGCSLGSSPSPPTGLVCSVKDATVHTDAPIAWDGGQRPSPVAVLTQHNDSARTGVNSQESCLTPQVVPTLSERTRFHVNGAILAQPLLFTGPRYLLVVATNANVLAAFDTSTLSSTPVWQLGPETFGIPGVVLPGPGQLGILSTPVIDPTTGLLYLISRSCASASTVTGCPQTLHVVDATTGKHLDSAPVVGSFTSADGGVGAFDENTQMNRPGLLLQGGKVYAAWGVMTALPNKRHEEDVIYHGYVMAFDTASLHTPPLLYVDSPNGIGAGIWQAGGGLAGDGDSVYFASGNLTLGIGIQTKTPSQFPTGPRDQENSVGRLWWSGGAPHTLSYWDDRPYHSDGNVFQYQNYNDYDLSSAGPGLIPGTNVVVCGSKGGILYALDKTTMKKTQEPLSPFHHTTLPAGQTLYIANDAGPEMLGSPVVWRRTAGTDDALLYFWPRNDMLTSFLYQHSTNQIAPYVSSTALAGYSGGALSFTWDGSHNSTAVLWASVSLGNGGGGEPSFIRAYDPTTLQQLWQGNVTGYPKFVAPTIAAGRVYMPSWSTRSSSDVIVYAAPACGG